MSEKMDKKALKKKKKKKSMVMKSVVLILLLVVLAVCIFFLVKTLKKDQAQGSTQKPDTEQSQDGADATDLYADNIKYGVMRSAENFKATVGAYMAPDEFDACDGCAEMVEGVTIGQQERTPFALAYRTRVESDTSKGGKDYKLNIIYNATAAPSERSHETVNDSPSAMELSWDVETTPIEVEGFDPTAHITIDSRKVSAAAMKKIEEALYGTDSEESKLLLPNEIVEMIKQADAAA